MKTSTLLKFGLIVGLSLWGRGASANNIRITTDPSLTTNDAGVSVHINFKLSWDNSWRTSNPRNWDAAWIFAKYSVGGGDWSHCFLDENMNNHSVTGIGQPEMIVEGGASRIQALGGSLRTVGVFIYRKEIGYGHIEDLVVALNWKYSEQGIAEDDPVTVNVFAIEMVYVNQGSFFLGAGGQEHFGFKKAASSEPFKVIAEDMEIRLVSHDVNDATGLANLGNNGVNGSWTQNRTLPTTFPRGYNAFYVMKYEVTQEAWADFVNTLPVAQQQNMLRDASGNPYIIDATKVGNNNAFPWGVGAPVTSYRQGIMLMAVKGNGVFACNLKNDGFLERNVNQYNDGQNIPVGYISTEEALSYLDWSGLRPLTELEFEKAARGPLNPVANEYVWGSGIASLTNCGDPANASTTIDNGEATERPLIGNINLIGQSPVRAGSFADTASTRASAGASYWGIMELNGNMWERYVNIQSNVADGFDGAHGDGNLDYATGDATPDLNWPTSPLAWMWRGAGYTCSTSAQGGAGSFTGAQYEVLGKASSRWYYAGVTAARTSHQAYGVRGGRTAGNVTK